MFLAGCTTNIGLKKLQREVGSTFCGAQASGDGPLGMIVLSPFAKGNGYENFIHYTHGSTLCTFRTSSESFTIQKPPTL
jgi:hypothetical protein